MVKSRSGLSYLGKLRPTWTGEFCGLCRTDGNGGYFVLSLSLAARLFLSSPASRSAVPTLPACIGRGKPGDRQHRLPCASAAALPTQRSRSSRLSNDSAIVFGAEDVSEATLRHSYSDSPDSRFSGQAQRKSPLVAFLLALFFGPLAMFCSTVKSAIGHTDSFPVCGRSDVWVWPSNPLRGDLVHVFAALP